MEVKPGGDENLDALGDQAIRRGVVWMRAHAYIKRLFVFMAFNPKNSSRPAVFRVLTIERTLGQHAIPSTVSRVFSFESSMSFAAGWYMLAQKPMDFFLMEGGATLMICLGELGVHPRLVRSRFLAQSRSLVFSVALPTKGAQSPIVKMHEFDLAIKVFDGKTKEDFGREVAALERLFVTESKPLVIPYAFLALEWADGDCKITQLCTGGQDQVNRLLEAAKQIHKTEILSQGDHVQQWTGNSEKWAGAIIMRHGLVTKKLADQAPKVWTLTPVTLANELAARSDGRRLGQLRGDIRLWLEHMRQQKVKHCDMRTANVVFFPNGESKVDTSKHDQGELATQGSWSVIDFGMARLDNEKLAVVWSSESAMCLHLPLSVLGGRNLEAIEPKAILQLDYPLSADADMFFGACISRGNGLLSSYFPAAI
jgi:hypothetical protein